MTTLGLDALRRRITVEEATLRSAAVEQMAGRVGRLLRRDGTMPRWVTPAGDLDRDALAGEVERLVGEEGVGDLDALRLHATWVALMFYEEPPVGSWWATPLGQLCGRVLHGED